jgi:hypothetical protein
MAAAHNNLYVRFRLFFVFGKSVMMHIATILLSLIGSAILLIPAWLRPLLSPVAQKTLDKYDAALPVSVYSHLAVALLIGGFILACFFAWEEERQESEEQRKEKERLEGLRDRPNIVARIIQPSGPHEPNAPFDILLRLELNNQGGQGRLDGWRITIRSLNGTIWSTSPNKTLYIDKPEESGVRSGEAVIGPPPPSSQIVPARDIVQAQVRFSSLSGVLTWGQATEKGTTWTVRFHDNTGRDYEADKTW